MANEVWFITGAASGFGDAFARYALDHGHRVVATARDPGKLATIQAIAPERVLVQRLDVTLPSEADEAVKAAVARFGRIDVLINNAGYAVVGAVEETSDAELRALMETNFFGAVTVTRAALPTLRSQRSGAIVNISSLGGQLSMAGFSAYCASKFALEGMSEALALELAPLGIKVLIVEPGAFRTNLAGAGMKHMPILEAYREIVADTRSMAHSMNGTQEGDPAKAAAAVARALASPHTPLRLQLGRDAVDSIRTHAEQLLAELKTWEQVALDTRL
ncbi:oxidoreductase [Rhodoligotrophos ferricapiens]|uniref:oxidoreductase n=1 Tax=Rhodoligotrophos ferricapiens TaxID=3069264 RepID=UPI00315D13CC